MVYGTVRGMILSGQLEQGAQIREEEIAEMCSVSRTPVREAFRQLEAELFLTRSESQRSFVANWTLPDIEEFFTLRGMLEGHAAKRAAQLANSQGLEELAKINSYVQKAIDRSTPDVDAFLTGNLRFHAAILDMAASERLAMLLNRLILQPIVKRTAMRYDASQLQRSHEEHLEITAAIGRGDPEWAGLVATAHIRRAFHVYVDGSEQAETGDTMPKR